MSSDTVGTEVTGGADDDAGGSEGEGTSVDDPRVAVGEYTWEHFKREQYYDEDGQPPRDGSGEVEPFEPEGYLGFDPEEVESVLATAAGTGEVVRSVEHRRTVDVNPDLDEDDFFSTADGHPTLVNRYDLEKRVSMERKRHFEEVERYWVDKPNAFVVIFHSRKENEKKYYLIDPYLNEIEADLVEFLSGKLRTTIMYSDDDVVVRGSDGDRSSVLEQESKRLLDRYDLRDTVDDSGIADRLKRLLGRGGDTGGDGAIEGIEARPEPAVLDEDSGRLNEYQIEKLLYVLERDFIGYERIDGIKHDINVEDISCDGYGSPVFVYHTDYENLITNVRHREDRLDDFVVKLAQRSGKGISKRQPQVDASLPDGSRAQLTLGEEVSDHGTNYTIRQFKDVPFTPVDLINWHTFSLDEMAFLWLCIENHKSLIFAGGTASGKTTSLNAVSLFIPANTKIVSIEDTREVELPQRNWVASVTRPSFSQDNVGDVDEFDLLEAALRQRPDHIVMGEVRGEEGRTLFQVMSTGHTTYTTFHADTVDEVLKRFTTDPINVSKTLFTALDLVSVQTQTRIQGTKVRRNKTITEIDEYDAENDEIRVQDVYQWQPERDEFLQQGTSKKLQEIAFDRGWSEGRLRRELFERRTILAYLIENDLNRYGQVAATIQAYINDPESILTLMANDRLEENLENLQDMESVLVDVDPEKEAMVPRPDPDETTLSEVRGILAEAEGRVFEGYRGREPPSLVDALPSLNDLTADHSNGNDEESMLIPERDVDTEAEHDRDPEASAGNRRSPRREGTIDGTGDGERVIDELGDSNASNGTDGSPPAESDGPETNGRSGSGG